MEETEHRASVQKQLVEQRQVSLNLKVACDALEKDIAAQVTQPTNARACARAVRASRSAAPRARCQRGSLSGARAGMAARALERIPCLS